MDDDAVPGSAMLNDQGETFGAWLLTQKQHDGWIGDLARAAASDPKFPRRGTAEDVRTRLRAMMAEGDMFEAVDDAESAWLAA